MRELRRYRFCCRHFLKKSTTYSKTWPRNSHIFIRITWPKIIFVGVTFHYFAHTNMETTKSTISLIGWVDEKPKIFAKHGFLVLRNFGEYMCEMAQIVVEDEKLFNLLIDGKITKETYIKVHGTKKDLPQNNKNRFPWELHATSIEIVSKSDADFSTVCPAKTDSLDVIYGKRHLWMRKPEFAATTILRSILISAMREYFDETMCVEIIPPCFVPNQCEGGSTLFKIDHVGQPAYLTQSSQFYLEMAVPAVGDCYCMYPSFRAEKSHTRRHLTEFLHLESEWSNVETMDQHIKKLQSMLVGILKLFLKNDSAQSLLRSLGKLEHVKDCLIAAENPVMMTHKEAITYCREHEIYKDPENKIHFEYEDDIPEAQERKMIDQLDRIVFLNKFPAHFKSFYMKKCEDDPFYVEGCDVEVPTVGEIIGSGIRVSDPDELLVRLKEQGLNEKDYEEYIDLRKYGHAKTSGMGLGVDRMLTWLLGAHNIKDVVTFPRFPGRISP